MIAQDQTTRGYYIAALALSLAVAAMYGWMILLTNFDRGAIVGACASAVCAFGLWSLSKLARVVGSLLFALAILSIVWGPLANKSSVVDSTALIPVIVIGFASTALVWLLTLSKGFSAEFSRRRASEPAYKPFLRRLFFAAIVSAVAYAIYEDIRHVPQSRAR